MENLTTVAGDKTGIRFWIEHFMKLGPVLRRNIANAMKVIKVDLQHELQEKSPKASGKFAGGWDVRIMETGVGTGGGGKTRIYINAINKTREDGVVYAAFMETGSVPGKPPWPSVPSTNPRTQIGLGGMIMSSQAPEGVVNAVLTPAFTQKVQATIERANHLTFRK